MYDLTYDESHIQDRREPGSGQSASCRGLRTMLGRTIRSGRSRVLSVLSTLQSLASVMLSAARKRWGSRPMIQPIC